MFGVFPELQKEAMFEDGCWQYGSWLFMRWVRFKALGTTNLDDVEIFVASTIHFGSPDVPALDGRMFLCGKTFMTQGIFTAGSCRFHLQSIQKRELAPYYPHDPTAFWPSNPQSFHKRPKFEAILTLFPTQRPWLLSRYSYVVSTLHVISSSISIISSFSVVFHSKGHCTLFLLIQWNVNPWGLRDNLQEFPSIFPIEIRCFPAQIFHQNRCIEQRLNAIARLHRWGGRWLLSCENIAGTIPNKVGHQRQNMVRFKQQ